MLQVDSQSRDDEARGLGLAGNPALLASCRSRSEAAGIGASMARLALATAGFAEVSALLVRACPRGPAAGRASAQRSQMPCRDSVSTDRADLRRSSAGPVRRAAARPFDPTRPPASLSPFTCTACHLTFPDRSRIGRPRIGGCPPHGRPFARVRSVGRSAPSDAGPASCPR